MNPAHLLLDKRQPPRLVLGRPTADRRIFRVNGEPWRYLGVTLFKLMEMYRRGVDIDPILARYPGFNTARVMRNKPPVPGLDEGWSAPPLDVALAFTRDMAARGWYVEHTLVTQIEADLSWLPGWCDALAPETNVFFEGVNEPDGRKSDYLDTARLALQGIHWRALGATAPFASGNYDPHRSMIGTYMTVHPDRSSDPYEAARKAKTVLELYDGWEEDPSRPYDYDTNFTYRSPRVPVVNDEPGKPQDFRYAADAMLSHFAITGLFCAGGTFHSLAGQFCLPHSDQDLACLDAALLGLTAFPADAPNRGGYVHDTTDEANTRSLRTYRSGQWGVRVRPGSNVPILIGV